MSLPFLAGVKVRPTGQDGFLEKVYFPASSSSFSIVSYNISPDMTDALSTSCPRSPPALCPIGLLFKYRWHASFHLIFGRRLFLSSLVIKPVSVLSPLRDLFEILRHSRCPSYYVFVRILYLRVTPRIGPRYTVACSSRSPQSVFLVSSS